MECICGSLQSTHARLPKPRRAAANRAQAATSLDELAECMLATEAALLDSALMAPHWAARGWQASWRAALRPGGAAREGMRPFGTHLAALSANVALPQHTWPRDAFMHTVEVCRCAAASAESPFRCLGGRGRQTKAAAVQASAVATVVALRKACAAARPGNSPARPPATRLLPRLCAGN